MAIRRWQALLVTLIFAGVLLKIQLVILVPVLAGLILILAASWRKRAFNGLSYKRQFYYTGAFPGEEVELKIAVENSKFLPVSWLKIKDPWPKPIGPVDEGILNATTNEVLGSLNNLFSLKWQETLKKKYLLKFRARGVYPVGPTTMETSDLFGFFNSVKTIDNRQVLTVFPQVLSVEELNLPPDNPFGDRKARRKIFEDPSFLMGIREYRPRDSFRQVHWPATAKTGDLKVKVYQPTSNQVLMACLNAETSEQSMSGYYPELFEYLLSITATLLDIGLKDGYQIGLTTNGMIANAERASRIVPGSSPRHLARLLSALAGVTPLLASSFEKYLVREMPNVPFGATLVIITAVIKEELIETILHLRAHGRRVVLVSVAKDEPPLIQGVFCLHLPYEGELEQEASFRNVSYQQ